MLTAETISEVLRDRHRVIAALADAHDQALAACPPALLRMAEHRVAMLLGVAVPAPTEPIAVGLDPDLERVALVFVEQSVIDVSSVTDVMVTDLAAHLGDDGLMDFVHGLLVVEQRLRLGLAWQQLGLAS